MNKSSIEWTTYTSNPIQAYAPDEWDSEMQRGWFCEKVSPGCAHCYSSTLNERRGRGNGLAFLPANRDKVTFRLNESELAEWSRKRRDGTPLYEGRCFAFDMTDLFGEWVSDDWLDKIFAAMALAPNLQFQILTKRPERMREYVKALLHGDRNVTGACGELTGEVLGYSLGRMEAAFGNIYDHKGEPLPNVWLGVTVENQRWADHRIPILLDTPAAVRFLSCEPMLGAIDLDAIYPGTAHSTDFAGQLDWVIVGGESGPKHRAFDPAWARSIVAQCSDAGVACFVKQLGGARPGNRLEDLPEDLRVREFPR
jgi:protein gp37